MVFLVGGFVLAGLLEGIGGVMNQMVTCEQCGQMYLPEAGYTYPDLCPRCYVEAVKKTKRPRPLVPSEDV